MADDNKNPDEPSTAAAAEEAAPTDAATTTTKKSKVHAPPPNIQPKPKLSKAERRALQEQQRAAKAGSRPPEGGGGGSGAPATSTSSSHPPAPLGTTSTPAPAKPAPGNSDPAAADVVTPPPAIGSSSNSSGQPLMEMTGHVLNSNNNNSNLLVGHLSRPPSVEDTFDTGATLRAKNYYHNNEPLPDAVVRLGYLYATGRIRGGNARCRAMLECYKEMLLSLPPPTTAASSPDALIKSAFQFWTTQCRPHSVTMGNAFTFLKAATASLMQQQQQQQQQNASTTSTTTSTIGERLVEIIETYQQERIEYADIAIAEIAGQKLLSNREEVILTFGHSEAVTAVLAKASMKRVIVVDSRPLLEGIYTYEALSSSGTTTVEYIDLTALTYVLPEVDKVLLGAAALQTDGSITGRIGTAVVALAAHAHHIPVLICAETYKISVHRGVPLESLTHNEVLSCWPPQQQDNDSSSFPTADGATTVSSSSLSLQLMYDLTPAKWISGIVTELGLVPPSSVAVLLREMNPQEFKSAGGGGGGPGAADAP